MGNDRIWEILFEAIAQKRIVPIIGDEFFYARVDGELVNYKKYVLDKLVAKYEPPVGSIPDFNMIAGLIEANNIKCRATGDNASATSIYYEINDIVLNTPIVCEQSLVDLLSTFSFPIILTTSYLPGLETSLKNLNIEIMAYDKSPRNDIELFDTSKTVFYYLFGKCGKTNKSYMATEDDLLEYMHYWHNIETRPARLSEALKDKFLLMLGCDYPNWLFRFFWHSIKNFNLLSGSYEYKGVVTGAILDTDNELARFLARIQTHTYSNGLDFMSELNEKKDRMMTAVPRNIGDVPPSADSPCDIFISYAHEDRAFAQAIADIIRKLGAKPWLDSYELVGSDHYNEIIKKKIDECERFMPILSTTTEVTKKGYFRKEWSLAIKQSEYRLGSPYIAPVAINEINYGSTLIPQEFRDAHILSFNSEDFENEIKRMIRSFRQ